MSILLSPSVARAIVDNTTRSANTFTGNPNGWIGMYDTSVDTISVAVLFSGSAPATFPTLYLSNGGTRTPRDIDGTITTLALWSEAYSDARINALNGYFNTSLGTDLAPFSSDLSFTPYTSGETVGVTVSSAYVSAVSSGTAGFLWFANLFESSGNYSVLGQAYATIGLAGSGADIIAETTTVTEGLSIGFSNCKLYIPTLSF